ncbi:MAG: hypothetical protein OXC07_03600 [Kistimonas sp.]|nr:hypothetical protein [Kistimonas sp.]
MSPRSLLFRAGHESAAAGHGTRSRWFCTGADAFLFYKKARMQGPGSKQDGVTADSRRQYQTPVQNM